MEAMEPARTDLAVKETEAVGTGVFRISLGLPSGAGLPRPGQFYAVRCGASSSTLLRRPFSVHRARNRPEGGLVDLLVRVVGPGTAWLGERRAGDRLDVIGPLGNGFDPSPCDSAVLAARGIGIAPLYALGEALRKTLSPETLHIVMGARTRERVFLRDRLAGLGALHLYTDDGSEGFRGRAPDLLRHLAKTRAVGQGCRVYACGPDAMLREIAVFAEAYGLEGQAALETHMGCGIGACLSCAVPLRPEAVRRSAAWPKPALQFDEPGEAVHSLICRDGPVYDLQEVDWDAWCP